MVPTVMRMPDSGLQRKAVLYSQGLGVCYTEGPPMGSKGHGVDQVITTAVMICLYPPAGRI